MTAIATLTQKSLNKIKTVSGYRPICGNVIAGFCSGSTTMFNGKQYQCPVCGWTSHVEAKTIKENLNTIKLPRMSLEGAQNV